MLTATGGSARRRLRLLRTTRPRLSRATSGVDPDSYRRTLQCQQSAGSGGGRRVGQRLVAVSDDELINEFWVVFLEPMLEPISIKY